MPRHLLRASLVALAVLLAGAPIALGAPSRQKHAVPSRAATAAPSLAARAWGTLRRIWAAEGSSLDPDGKPHQAVLPSPRLAPTPDSGGS
jgi:hypothetical protein